MGQRIIRAPSAKIERLNSFSVTVWGETMPSQVERLLNSAEATRSSQFTVTEGDAFKKLQLFHNVTSIGLLWSGKKFDTCQKVVVQRYHPDELSLYGGLFTAQGEIKVGTQRLNQGQVSVFPSGDHVLTTVTTVNGSRM